MAWRALALALASLPALAALGALAADAQPSAQRVAVAATVGLLAPLLWPGTGPTATRTGTTVLLWSAVAAGVAAIGMAAAGGAPRAGAILPVGAMLCLVLLVVHAACAALELRWRRSGVPAGDARELAGRVACLVLAGLGALPLWLGPAAEALSLGLPGMADAALGASPLVHLALASGNDLLRNQWFYQHANLASLPVGYPSMAAIASAYIALVAPLAWTVRTMQRRRPGAPSPTTTTADMEKT